MTETPTVYPVPSQFWTACSVQGYSQVNSTLCQLTVWILKQSESEWEWQFCMISLTQKWPSLWCKPSRPVWPELIPCLLTDFLRLQCVFSTRTRILCLPFPDRFCHLPTSHLTPVALFFANSVHLLLSLKRLYWLPEIFCLSCHSSPLLINAVTLTKLDFACPGLQDQFMLKRPSASFSSDVDIQNVFARLKVWAF